MSVQGCAAHVGAQFIAPWQFIAPMKGHTSVYPYSYRDRLGNGFLRDTRIIIHDRCPIGNTL